MTTFPVLANARTTPIASTDSQPNGGVLYRLRLPRDSRPGPEAALPMFSAVHRLGFLAAFELFSAGAGGEVRFWAPRPDLADLLRQQLASAYPHSHFQLATRDLPRTAFTLGAALGLRSPDPIPLDPLGGGRAAKAGAMFDRVPGLLAALDEVRRGEWVLFQLVLRPATGSERTSWTRDFLAQVEQHRREPASSGSIWELFRKPQDPAQLAHAERVADAVKGKLGDALFHASLRLLSSAATKERTSDLFRSALAPLTSTGDARLNALVPLVPPKPIDVRAQAERRLLTQQVLLSRSECLGLWHPPSGDAGVGRGTLLRGADLPIQVATPAGIQIGWASAGPDAEPIRLPMEELRKHAAAVGGSGTGKSTALITTLLSLIELGYGCGLLDVKGDLSRDLLGRIPAHRIEDVIVVDPTDRDFPVAIDLFGIARRLDLDLATDLLVSAFRLQFSESWGVSFPRLMKAATRALLEVPGTCVTDLPAFLRDARFRASILERVQDEATRSYFDYEFNPLSPSRQMQAVGPVLTRVGAALESSFGRRIFGQPGGIDLRKVQDGRKVLICLYEDGLIGKQNAAVFAGLTAAACLLTAMTRIDLLENQRVDWLLVCDEAHEYVTRSFTEALTIGRGYRLSVILATQFLGLLPADVRSSVLANTSTMICFRLGEEDAAILGRRFEPQIARFDLTDLPNYTALVRASLGSERLAPFSLHVRPPDEPSKQDVATAVRERSRQKYGQAPVVREQVHPQPKPTARQRPVAAPRWDDIEEDAK